MLLETCPSFRTRWTAYVAESGYDESLLYVHLGKFARHLVELLKAGSTAEFAAVFNAVEGLHVDGDEYVREAVTIGFLEGLQNVAGHAGIDPESFAPYLRSESMKWWAELNGFWSGQGPRAGAS